MDFVILPRGPETGRLYNVLLCHPRAIDGVGGGRVVVATSNGQEVSIKSYGREEDIPLNERYRYRLLTKPKK
jgi:hypothetical protein